MHIDAAFARPPLPAVLGGEQLSRQTGEGGGEKLRRLSGKSRRQIKEIFRCPMIYHGIVTIKTSRSRRPCARPQIRSRPCVRSPARPRDRPRSHPYRLTPHKRPQATARGDRASCRSV